MQDMTGSRGADTVGSESATRAGFLPRSFAIASYSEDLSARNGRSNFVVLPFFALRVRRKLLVLALKSIGPMVKLWARGLLFERPMVGCAKSGQKGFTLVELLVVIAIIGLLAAIAITQYALYKQKATDAAMESVLASARQAMEGFYVENNTYVGTDPVLNLPNHGYRATQNVTLNITGPPTTTTYGLLACAIGGTSPAFSFDTTLGITQAAPGPCS